MGIFVYEVRVKCDNCGEETTLRIPRGRTIDDYLGNKKGKCKNCGCTTISRKGVVQNVRKEEDLSGNNNLRQLW